MNSIIIIACEDQKTAKDRELIAIFGIHQVKRWVRGVNLLDIEYRLNHPGVRSHNQLPICFNLSDLKGIPYVIASRKSNVKTIVAVLNKSEIREACEWLNENMIQLPNWILSGNALSEVPNEWLIRITLEDTRTRDKGAVEIFSPASHN